MICCSSSVAKNPGTSKHVGSSELPEGAYFHKDCRGAGLVLMQLAVPRLRSSSALRSFNNSLQNVRCDLHEWRARERLPVSQTAALDADNGAGWDLAQALLRPRKVEVRLSFMPPALHLRCSSLGMYYLCNMLQVHALKTILKTEDTSSPKRDAMPPCLCPASFSEQKTRP